MLLGSSCSIPFTLGWFSPHRTAMPEGRFQVTATESQFKYWTGGISEEVPKPRRYNLGQNLT